MDTIINSDGVYFITLILLMITPGGLANVADWEHRSTGFRRRVGARRYSGFPSYRHFAKPLVICRMSGNNPFFFMFCSKLAKMSFDK